MKRDPGRAYSRHCGSSLKSLLARFSQSCPEALSDLLPACFFRIGAPVDGGQAIDTTGVFPDGSKFDGVTGLKRELLRHPEQFAGTVAERLLMYAVGRNLQYYDAPAVRAVLREAALSRYTLASLVLGVVKSRPFQMREGS